MIEFQIGPETYTFYFNISHHSGITQWCPTFPALRIGSSGVGWSEVEGEEMVSCARHLHKCSSVHACLPTAFVAWFPTGCDLAVGQAQGSEPPPLEWNKNSNFSFCLLTSHLGAV